MVHHNPSFHHPLDDQAHHYTHLTTLLIIKPITPLISPPSWWLNPITPLHVPPLNAPRPIITSLTPFVLLSTLLLGPLSSPLMPLPAWFITPLHLTLLLIIRPIPFSFISLVPFVKPPIGGIKRHINLHLLPSPCTKCHKSNGPKLSQIHPQWKA